MTCHLPLHICWCSFRQYFLPIHSVNASCNSTMRENLICLIPSSSHGCLWSSPAFPLSRQPCKQSSWQEHQLIFHRKLLDYVSVSYFQPSIISIRKMTSMPSKITCIPQRAASKQLKYFCKLLFDLKTRPLKLFQFSRKFDKNREHAVLSNIFSM